MSKNVFIFLGLLGLSACGTLNQESTATSKLTYETTTFLQESVKGCKEDQACARYKVTYPVFTGLTGPIQDSLQREIEMTVSMGDPDASKKTMAIVAKEFLNSYQEFAKEMPDGGAGWYYEADVKVNILTDTLLSLEVNEDYFTGGAHGGNGTYFINRNPKTGAESALSSLLKPGFESELRKAGEKAFRKARELADTATYRFNGFEFPQDKFKLNSNYGFGEKGITFVFNSYEVAPYVLGPTEIFIPYSELKGWLK